MAKLYFRYGAMNSGKTTALMQVAYNYKERGMRVLILKPAIDTKGQDSRGREPCHDPESLGSRRSSLPPPLRGTSPLLALARHLPRIGGVCLAEGGKNYFS